MITQEQSASYFYLEVGTLFHAHVQEFFIKS